MGSLRGFVAAAALSILGTLPGVTAQWSNYSHYSSDTYDVDENYLTGYLTGYLTWRDGAGGVAWAEAATSEDSAGTDFPLRGIQSGVGWTLRMNAGDDTTVPTEEFISEPLPTTLFLNVTRPIHIDIFTQACFYFLTELYAGDVFVGGSMWGDVYPTWKPKEPDGYCVKSVRLHSETDRLEAGTRLRLVILWADRYDAYNTYATKAGYGLAGDHRSVIRIPYLAGEDFYARVPNAPTSSAVAYLELPTASDQASSRTAFAFPFAPLALARRRRPGLLIALVLLFGGFAGCFGSGGPPAVVTNAGPAASNGAAESTIFPHNGTLGSRFGSLFGVVHDDLYIPVGGVHVSLLGSENFTRSDEQGRFLIENILPGEYTARFDRQDFKSFEADVCIVRDSLTRLDVTLEPTVDRDFRPHRHDYWTDRTSVPWLQQMVTFSDVQGPRRTCMSSGIIQSFVGLGEIEQGDHCRQDLVLPEPDGTFNAIVLPGTYDMEIKVTWDTAVNQVEWVGVGFLSNAAPGGAAPVSTFVNETLMYPKASGVSTHLRTSWEMTDVGHQQFSTWRLFLYIPTLGRKPNFMSGSFDVTVVLHKGVVPLEPGHRDFWGEKVELPVLENGQVVIDCATTCSFPSEQGWTPVRLVPPGTARLALTLTQDKATLPDPFDWGIFYKPANVPPQAPGDASKFERAEDPKVDPTGLQKEFTLILEPEEADAFYAQRSNWQFLLDDGHDGSMTFTNGPIAFSLSITAFKETATSQTDELLRPFL